jgi:serine/threonine-protein kinase
MWRHIQPLFGARSSVPAELSAATSSELPATTPPTLVPDLVGLPSTDARRLARAARLAVTVEERPSSQGLWGRVLAQDPEPGTLGAPDGIVVLTVGARARVPVPDVRGRDEDEALSMLREAGLGAARRATRRSDRVPEGCVVRTRPRAGADVATGSRISYVIAASRPDDRLTGRKRGRRHVHVARLADGSFLSPGKSLDRRRP